MDSIVVVYVTSDIKNENWSEEREGSWKRGKGREGGEGVVYNPKGYRVTGLPYGTYCDNF
jgi:hypothetical protein